MHPRKCLALIAGVYPEILGLAVIGQRHGSFFLITLEDRNLAIRTMHEVIKEGRLYGARIETGGAEFVQQHVAGLDGPQHVLPDLGYRAFMRQQRSGAELESDLPEFRVVDPVVPFAQEPNPACHDDSSVFAHAFGAHSVPESLNARIGVFRLPRVLGVGQTIVSARQPRILINHCRHQLRHLRIATLPKGAKGARRADDREVMNIEARGDFGQLVRHSRTAGDAGNQPLAVLENAFEHLLRASHFPQHIDVDRPLAVGDLIGALDLFGRAIDAIAHELFETLLAGRLRIDLRNRVAIVIVTISIHGTHGADPASGSPGPRARMIRCGNPLAPFHQRPDFAATVKNWAQPLETHYTFSLLVGRNSCASAPAAFSLRHGLISPGSGLLAAALNCA